MHAPSDKNPGQPLLLDSFGRHLTYLRLSITDLCNLRCTYCMPSQGVEKLPQEQILTLEELGRVARLAVSMGVNKIRLTGGEPLLRKGLGRLLDELKGLSPRPDLRITTNGLLLAQHLPMLINAGISTINVSLDTLKPELYGRITGMGQSGEKNLQRVWQGIEAALESGQVEVKINTVLLAGINDAELVDFARLTLERPLAVRFIEYMPVGRRTPFQADCFMSGEEALSRLKSLGDLSPLSSRPGDGPAQRFKLIGAMGELGIITAMTSHFCATCNRLRLSSEGQLVPCLFADPVMDLRPLLRRGASDRELMDALAAAAQAKPKGHQLQPANLHAAGCQMSRLGG